MKIKSFLLKAINGSCTKDEHDFLHESYHGDIEVDYLEAAKEVWKTIFRDSKPTRFSIGNFFISKKDECYNQYGQFTYADFISTKPSKHSRAVKS